MDENQVEDFLDDVAEHCFKKGMSPAEFINDVNEVARVSSKIEVPIDELQNFIADKQKESNELGFKITFRRIEMDQLMREHNATKAQLQAFMACLPFLLKLLPLKQILFSMDIEKIIINKEGS